MPKSLYSGEEFAYAEADKLLDQLWKTAKAHAFKEPLPENLFELLCRAHEVIAQQQFVIRILSLETMPKREVLSDA